MEFTAKDVKRCSEPHARDVAFQILRLFKADSELNYAKDHVPNYTGQYSREDYIAREQEEWNRAADDLAYHIRRLTGTKRHVGGCL